VNRDATNTASATFDLSLGTNTQTQVNGGIYSSPSATITAVAQSFYRCTFTLTTDSATSFRIGFSNTGTPSSSNRGFGASYTGNGTSSLILWGAQLEAGAFATSYIPTVASQVTRAGDLAVMTGTNFSSWYNATEGTFYAQFTPAASNFGANKNIFVASDGTTNNFIGLRYASSGSQPTMAATTSAVVQANVATGAMVAGTNYKLAGAYKANDFAASRNAGTVGTDTSGTIPTVTQAAIGALASVGIGTQHIQRLVYYPRRLSNAELQGLTS
jgi:hypothetical protein